MNQAVVLAGGLATRMLPRTAETPKILLEVAGRPFLSHLLDRLTASGFDHVVLAVGHLAGPIREVAKAESAARGLRITLSEDGPRLLGTGGALRRALPVLEETVLVTYGDSYLPFDYLGPLTHLRAHASGRGAMAVFANYDSLEPSNVTVGGGRVRRYDKSRAPGEPLLDHIDYGATALRRSEIESLPQGEPFGLEQLLSFLALSGGLLACPVSERFYEIGSPNGLAELNAHLKELTAQLEERAPRA